MADKTNNEILKEVFRKIEKSKYFRDTANEKALLKRAIILADKRARENQKAEFEKIIDDFLNKTPKWQREENCSHCKTLYELEKELKQKLQEKIQNDN